MDALGLGYYADAASAEQHAAASEGTAQQMAQQHGALSSAEQAAAAAAEDDHRESHHATLESLPASGSDPTALADASCDGKETDGCPSHHPCDAAVDQGQLSIETHNPERAIQLFTGGQNGATAAPCEEGAQSQQAGAAEGIEENDKRQNRHYWGQALQYLEKSADVMPGKQNMTLCLPELLQSYVAPLIDLMQVAVTI